MSRYTRRAGKRDTLEPEIIAIAKKHGWLVKQADWVDLICQRICEYGADGIDITTTKLVEVKTGNAKLTDGQKQDIKDGWVIDIVRTIEEAEELFQ